MRYLLTHPILFAWSIIYHLSCFHHLMYYHLILSLLSHRVFNKTRVKQVIYLWFATVVSSFAHLDMLIIISYTMTVCVYLINRNGERYMLSGSLLSKESSQRLSKWYGWCAGQYIYVETLPSQPQSFWTMCFNS